MPVETLRTWTNRPRPFSRDKPGIAWRKAGFAEGCRRRRSLFREAPCAGCGVDWDRFDDPPPARGAVVTERLLSARELAGLLGFSAGTIVDWFEAGTLPGFKIGGRLRFRQSEVEAWLEARRGRALVATAR